MVAGGGGTHDRVFPDGDLPEVTGWLFWVERYRGLWSSRFKHLGRFRRYSARRFGLGSSRAV
jgi:hypothetical protein